MRPSFLRDQWYLIGGSAFRYGLLAGLLWGFLTSTSALPPEWLIYDEVTDVIYKVLDDEILARPLATDKFFTELNNTLVQVTLTFLVLVGLVGWSTWQLTRIRPRGEEQPSLLLGLDWYLIGLAIGGLIFVVLFRMLGLAVWFKGSLFTPARIVTIALGILLPVYMGVSLFLVWFYRLKSARAPDWDTRYPKRPKRSGGFLHRLFRRKKGGTAFEK